VQNCMLKGKIHGATVTDANVAYEGSITIDRALMEAAGILTHERVQVWSVTTGERLATYAIPGAAGSGEICVNGAAAHRIKKDEVVIIAAFAWMDEKEAVKHEPSVVFVDGRNRISERRQERRRVAAG
jgi:aspartate 1-decarboxylase